MTQTPIILTLNCGSSSVKFAAYPVADADAEPLLTAKLDLRDHHASLHMRFASGESIDQDADIVDAGKGLELAASVLADLFGQSAVVAVGHRIAHGGSEFRAPTLLDDNVIARLEALVPFAPLHQPYNLSGIEATRRHFPQARQIGCFDTAFHRDHPWVNDVFALPRQYWDEGVKRYGFHGLSYEFVAGRVATDYAGLAQHRMIIAHLGSGASMCAIKDGKSIASTMGFSALDGLPMATRCGQVDPGVLLYLMDRHQMSAAAISDLLYKHSGLKGLSGISGDMRLLEQSEAPEASQAIDYFIFRVRREIGAMCVALGGLDMLVFTGGVGENSATIRQRVCDGLEWLGITLDHEKNFENAAVIQKGTVNVLALPTNEEAIIYRAAIALLQA